MAGTVGPPGEHVLREDIGDEIILLDSETERFYELNATASDVWRLAGGEFTLDEMIAELAAAYATDPEIIRPDVERLVAEWRTAGLIPA